MAAGKVQLLGSLRRRTAALRTTRRITVVLATHRSRIRPLRDDLLAQGRREAPAAGREARRCVAIKNEQEPCLGALRRGTSTGARLRLRTRGSDESCRTAGPQGRPAGGRGRPPLRRLGGDSPPRATGGAAAMPSTRVEPSAASRGGFGTLAFAPPHPWRFQLKALGQSDD